MAKGMVGFVVDNVWFHFGWGPMLFSFFSTVTGRLEKSWGERFPHIMNDLCDNSRIAYKDLDAALDEIRTIRKELKAFPPKALIWDIEHPEKISPWGPNNENIRCDDIIPDLSCVFRTEDRVNVIPLLERIFLEAKEKKTDVELRFYPYKNQ